MVKHLSNGFDPQYYKVKTKPIFLGPENAQNSKENIYKLSEMKNKLSILNIQPIFPLLPSRVWAFKIQG
ncbi:rCG63343 [Rattus norvegicus]|uniref:RCG63343 n=1 Tax=Rattus norvegicus TaxID=10116 RepID=A6J7J8_RAT|nr:rCG63343 [Rattus norvegicus]